METDRDIVLYDRASQIETYNSSFPSFLSRPVATDFPRHIFYGLQRYLNNQTSFRYINTTPFYGILTMSSYIFMKFFAM